MSNTLSNTEKLFDYSSENGGFNKPAQQVNFKNPLNVTLQGAPTAANWKDGLAQIQQQNLQKKPTHKTNTAGVSMLAQNWKPGIRISTTKDVQKYLNEKGITDQYGKALVVDDAYGDRTYNAIQNALKSDKIDEVDKNRLRTFQSDFEKNRIKPRLVQKSSGSDFQKPIQFNAWDWAKTNSNGTLYKSGNVKYYYNNKFGRIFENGRVYNPSTGKMGTMTSENQVTWDKLQPQTNTFSFTKGKTYNSVSDLNQAFDAQFMNYLKSQNKELPKNYRGGIDMASFHNYQDYNSLYKNFRENNKILTTGDRISNTLNNVNNWFKKHNIYK